MRDQEKKSGISDEEQKAIEELARAIAKKGINDDKTDAEILVGAIGAVIWPTVEKPTQGLPTLEDWAKFIEKRNKNRH